MEEKQCETCSDEQSRDSAQKPRREQEKADQKTIDERFCLTKHKILVLSGKGGVGKSTIAVNLAVALADAGHKVGLLDIDIHGPSIPQMLNLHGAQLIGTGDMIEPVIFGKNLKVMSIGFAIKELDAPVIWRGPMKMQIIKQFLKDVDWGVLDYLIVDSPPGTGDEPLSIAQLVPHPASAVMVTTPQQVSVIDVRRCINFCRKVDLQLLGVIENMSGFVCPHCGVKTDIFRSGGGRTMAEDMRVPFLGSIPIEQEIVNACDEGKPFLQHHSDSGAGAMFSGLIKLLEAGITAGAASKASLKSPGSDDNMIRIALPVSGGRLSDHFGHCECFILADVDEKNKTILKMTEAPSPGHQPGILPRWLQQQAVDVVLTPGMGERAKQLFDSLGIKVLVGVAQDNPEQAVRAYLDGALLAGKNVCDH